MIEDYVVEEIHQIRERMLADCNGDLNELLNRIRASKA